MHRDRVQEGERTATPLTFLLPRRCYPLPIVPSNEPFKVVFSEKNIKIKMSTSLDRVLVKVEAETPVNLVN